MTSDGYTHTPTQIKRIWLVSKLVVHTSIIPKLNCSSREGIYIDPNAKPYLVAHNRPASQVPVEREMLSIKIENKVLEGG